MNILVIRLHVLPRVLKVFQLILLALFNLLLISVTLLCRMRRPIMVLLFCRMNILSLDKDFTDLAILEGDRKPLLGCLLSAEVLDEERS
jgi:hypothetical protein